MSGLVPKPEFWADVLPQLAFAPLSVQVYDVLRCFEDPSALRAASPKSRGTYEYLDLGRWAQRFAAIDLWSIADVDARCRALAAALIAEASPHARLKLFHLLDLWASAYAPDVAAQIEDSLQPHFDLERGVERDPLDALRVLASVCTLLGSEHMDYTGLAVVVDDEASPNDSAQIVADRLVRRGIDPDGLQVHGPCNADGTPRDPPKLTPIRVTYPSELADGIARFFANYVDRGHLSELQQVFVAEDLRACIDRLLADAELHMVETSRSLTCCGSALYLVASTDRWLAIQFYMYC